MRVERDVWASTRARVSMMSNNCPECNSELNEQLECERCAQVATDARDFAYEDMPTEPDENGEIDPEVETAFAHEYSGVDVESAAGSADTGVDESPFEDAGDYRNGGDALLNELDDVAEDIELPPTPAPSFNTSAKEIKTNISSFGGSIVINPPALAAPAPKDDDRTLIDFTKALPPKSPQLPEFVFDELPQYLAKLKEERLVLISCPDEDVAYSAAHALIYGLKLPHDKQRRLLNIDRGAAEDSPLSIYDLSSKRKSKNEVVVVVDATTERAKPFLEPIIRANRLLSGTIQDDLRRNKMYMLCLVEPALLDDGTRPDDELKFPCWRIPFLRRLLERYIEHPDDVEQQIRTQRANGLWSLNDSPFYFELKSYLLRRELPAELERRAKTPQRSAEELFKEEDPLSAAVLYVATYFPKLTPPEFNRLVPLLCNDAASRANSNAGTQDHLQAWWMAPDKILKNCSLTTIPLSDSTRGVSFNNHKLGGELKEYLEREYNFFLENKFRDVQKLGLIFSPSAQVAQNAVQLCVEKAGAYPEYYGSGWLAGLVTDFETAFSNTEPGEPFAWRFISEPNAVKARKQFYQRLAELIGSLTEHPQAAEVVDSFLQQLLLAKHRGAVLEIVRRLQFVTSFDPFKWLKQLFDQGNQPIREQTSDYLRGHLKRIRRGIYQALSSLELWLPKDARPLEHYPIPARYALRLMNEYFRETNSRFDARNFGVWPSTHPLFAFTDAMTAVDNIGLLVRLVFHPGMYSVAVTNRRITNWFYVLEGKGEGVPQELGNDADATELDAAAVSNFLLKEIARGVNPIQQDALAVYWREESDRLLVVMSSTPHGGATWQSNSWRRDLVIGLIKRFEPLRRRAMGKL